MKRKRKKISLERKNKRILHKKSRQKAVLKIQSAWKVALQRRELDKKNEKLNAIRSKMDCLSQHCSEEHVEYLKESFLKWLGTISWITLLMGITSSIASRSAILVRELRYYVFVTIFY